MLLHEEAEEAEEDEESVKIMFTYRYFIPHVIFSSHFLHAVTFLPVLHLDVLRRQIETETEISAIMLDHPWQSLYTQYYRTV